LRQSFFGAFFFAKAPENSKDYIHNFEQTEACRHKRGKEKTEVKTAWRACHAVIAGVFI
jgi:hypothetical protein